MACKETLPAPYQNMTPEQALDEAFKIMLKNYGKTKHKLITSRQNTKEILRGIKALNEEKAKSNLTDVLQTLLDMFDIAEMTLDHVHDTKLIYMAYKRERSRLYTEKR